MFALVRDVAQYPKFLPWCAASHIQPPANAPADAPADASLAGETLVARVDIAYMGVRSSFTTRNVHHGCETIDLTLVDGPFRDLRGRWSFQPLREEGCKVTLDLHYRFAAGLLGRVVAPVFEHVANSLIDAFAQRADQIYGTGD